MFEYEELTDIIGCSCTLLIPYRGRTEGFVVADYGEDIVVKLRNGKEIVERRMLGEGYTRQASFFFPPVKALLYETANSLHRLPINFYMAML